MEEACLKCPLKETAELRTTTRLCLKGFEQVHGAAMGSPIRPLIAKLFMDEFVSKAISTAPIQPGFCQGMWMTPLSSNRLNIVISSSNTLTLASSLTLKILGTMALFLS